MEKRKFPRWVIVAILIVFAASFYWQSTEAARLVSIGEEIFLETCFACHGVNGEGDANDLMATALNEDGHAWIHSDAQLRIFIKNGVGNMPSFRDVYSDIEIHGLVSYIKTLWPEDKRVKTNDIQTEHP